MREHIPLRPLQLADRSFLCCSNRFFIPQAHPNSGAPIPHIHDCYEVYINFSGDVSFLVNDRVYAVESGDVIISRPREMHAGFIHSPCVYEAYCFWFLPTEPTPLSAFADGARVHRHLRFSKPLRDQLKELTVRLYQAEAAGNELERTAWIYHLLMLLNSPAEPEQFSIPAALPETLQQILSHINLHFPQINTTAEIADRFFISTATLTRWFREYLHISPKVYLQARRLSFSKSLLVQGHSVTETAIRAGFSTCSRFIAAFKNAFGSTPLQYQKQHAVTKSEL